MDQDIKAVFDRRAEQRGEQALNAHRALQESLQGTVNPELNQYANASWLKDSFVGLSFLKFSTGTLYNTL